MPIMQQVRALAKTLGGNPTDVSYPPLPVLVKTPAIPTVVAPPAPGQAGEWTIETTENGLEAHFKAADASLKGFALLGAPLLANRR